MTLKQKLELEHSGEPLIRLYKEGIFFVAYNHSALRFKHFICPKVKLLKHQLKNGDSYIRAGVVQESPLLQELPIKDGFGNWLDSVTLECESIETSVSDVVPDKVIERSLKPAQKKGGCQQTVECLVADEIRQTDTGSLTPVQALVFIENWKKKLVSANVSSKEGI